MRTLGKFGSRKQSAVTPLNEDCLQPQEKNLCYALVAPIFRGKGISDSSFEDIIFR
jgi:hypothetical protein